MKVKELLSDPERWTQGTFARDKFNMLRGSTDEEACKWCLLGAIRKCYPSPSEYGTAHSAIKTAVIQYSGNNRIAVFNDTATHEDILKVLEVADV